MNNTAEDQEEEITKKTCPECKGSGQWVKETSTGYSGGVCAFCKGCGMVPMSGTHKAVGWTKPDA